MVGQTRCQQGLEVGLEGGEVGRFPVDAAEGRLRVVLDEQLDGAGDLLAREALDQMECHVDTGRHSGGGEHGPGLDPAIGHRNGAELVQQAAETPMSGGLAAVQQAGGAQDQRAGTHRADDLSRSRGLTDPAQQGLAGIAARAGSSPPGTISAKGLATWSNVWLAVSFSGVSVSSGVRSWPTTTTSNDESIWASADMTCRGPTKSSGAIPG